MNKEKGFTLIEVMLFAIIIGILASSILTPFIMVLKGMAQLTSQITTTAYTSQCLEWFLGQRNLLGFNSINCGIVSVPTFCNTPNGYTITANVSCGTPGYKTITTTVANNNVGVTSLSLVVANY